MKTVENTHTGELHDLEKPWESYHDVSATTDAVQTMIAGGTPNWFKWPHEYKNFVRESFQEEKERSDRMAVDYKWHDQDMLTNKEARQVHAISTRDFVEKKLKANGINAIVMVSDWKNHGGGPTVALWCALPGSNQRLRYVGYMDVPFMYEWSILNLDGHGIPNGELSRGWRTLAVLLVQKEIITEAQCHQIFGAPPANQISSRYYRSLWEKRNGKRYEDEDERGVGE